MTTSQRATPSVNYGDEVITKYTQILARPNGHEVKLVATAFYGAGLHLSVGVDVFRRENAEQQWEFCPTTPHPDWRDMSVDEYVANGRAPAFQAASHGEIIRAAAMIGKPISALS